MLKAFHFAFFFFYITSLLSRQKLGKRRFSQRLKKYIHMIIHILYTFLTRCIHVFHIFHNLPYIFSHSHTQLIYIMLNATLIYIFVSIPQKCDLCVPRTRRARENEKKEGKGVSKISKIKKVKKNYINQ